MSRDSLHRVRKASCLLRAGAVLGSLLVPCFPAGAQSEPAKTAVDVAPEEPSNSSPPPAEATTSGEGAAEEAQALSPGEPAPQGAKDSDAQWLTRLDRVLKEAAEDLQLELHWLAPSTTEPIDEESLQSRGTEGLVIAPQLLLTADGWILRLTAVSPAERPSTPPKLTVFRKRVDEQTLEVTAIQALRHLTSSANSPRTGEQDRTAAPLSDDETQRSPGKAELAVHGALVGAYVGYSLEHIGGSGDARLIYPLVTLGAGAGVGASLVIAEEWDISEPEARYMWAAGTWPTLSALFLATGRGVKESEAHIYGVLGATSGLSLGALALSTGDLKRGGDDLAHSGAALGALLGAVGEMIVEGDTELTPWTGLGAGTGVGVLVAGALAPHVELSRSRVLFADLSATLGALAGAALASPLLVGDTVTETENRIFLGATGLGTLLGAGVGIWLTRDRDTEATPAAIGFRPGISVLNPLPIRTAPGTLPPIPSVRTHVLGLTGSF